MSHATLPRTPARFLDWIQTSYAPHAVIGLRSNEYGCPLAAYLAAHGAPFPCVYATTYSTGSRGPQRRLPSWAQTLVPVVDASGPAHSAIRASEVLALLQGASL